MQSKEIRLSPWQAQVWDDPHRYIVINCGRRCLSKNTKVWTSKGLKEIQHINKNDKVWSWGRQSDRYELNKVTKVFKFAVDYDPKPMISFEYDNEIYKSSYDHPYFYKGQYVPIYQLVSRDLETSQKSKLKLLCKQYGKTLDNELVWFEKDESNETSPRPMRLSSHNDRLQNNKDTQNNSPSIPPEQREQTTSKSQGWGKDKQQSREFGVGNTSGEYSSCDGTQSSSTKPWRKERFTQDNRGASQNNNRISKIKQLLWFCYEICKNIGNKPKHNSGYKTWKNLVVSESEDTYCIEVENNHNFFIGKHAFLTHNSGKTYLCSIKLLDFASKNKKTRVWYVAPTYKQAKNILWEMLRSMIPQYAINKRNETELKIELVNGSVIEIKGAENVDSLRGVGIDFLVFDECAFIDNWDEAWKVMRPTLVDTRAKVWFISTPNGLQNHFKELADRHEVDSSWAYHHYTSYDNPFLEGGREELDKSREEMDEDSFAQEYLGEFRKMSGLIYKEFDRKVHMVDIPDIEFNHTYVRTLDFGWAHKTALGYFAVNKDATAVYMYDGIYSERITESDLAKVINIKDGNKIISWAMADSAQPMSIATLQEHGVHFAPVKKGRDSVKNGIAKVATLLKIRKDTGKPTLMFNKNLQWVADEFEHYRWMQNKQDNAVHEVPYKVLDDAMDMIRYFAISYVEEPFLDRKKYGDNYELVNEERKPGIWRIGR